MCVCLVTMLLTVQYDKLCTNNGLSLRTCVASLSKCIRVCDEGLVEERKQGRFASTGKQKKIVKGN